MDKTKTESGFCDSLLKIVAQERLTLFAGAGVGVRAGLPDWRGFVEHLISVAAKYEKETAAIMQARAKAGLLADAVSYYKVCRLILYLIDYKRSIAHYNSTRR